MAGISWIKIETTLPSKPVVLTLRRLLKQSQNSVVGMLVRLLCWADGVTDDGTLRGLTVDDLDIIVDCEGFGAALLQAGWLTQGDDLSFSEWDRHNGQGAKRRAMNARCNAEYKHKMSGVRDEGEQKVSKNAHPQNTECSHGALLDKIRIDKNIVCKQPRTRTSDEYVTTGKVEEPKSEPKALPDQDAFNEFVRIYPRKESLRGTAICRVQRAWREAIEVVGYTSNDILRALNEAITSPRWTEKHGQFIPKALAFLENEEMLAFLPAGFQPASRRVKPQTSRQSIAADEFTPIEGLDF